MKAVKGVGEAKQRQEQWKEGRYRREQSLQQRMWQ